jgi:hypothetical protein
VPNWVTIRAHDGRSERMAPDTEPVLSWGNNLVAGSPALLRDEEVAGSNPVTPTTKVPGQELLAELRARLSSLLRRAEGPTEGLESRRGTCCRAFDDDLVCLRQIDGRRFILLSECASNERAFPGMCRPTLGKPAELLDLGRSAPALFHALREQFDVRHPHMVDLAEPVRPLDELFGDLELAAVGMRYAQVLHQFGQPGLRVRSEEVVTLLSALDLVLERLLAESDHEPGLAVLRRVHARLAKASFQIAAHCGHRLSYLE